jgi:hypothetical protein
VVRTVADLIVSYLERHLNPCCVYQSASSTADPRGTRTSESSTGSETMGYGRNGVAR